MGEVVGVGGGATVSLQTSPLRHLVSPKPFPSPSTTMNSVEMSPEQSSRHSIGEYETPPSTEASILPPQALVWELDTLTPTRPGL